MAVQLTRRALGLSLCLCAVLATQAKVDVAVELEKPGMDEATAAAIKDYSTNACPATVELIRASVASNYDFVVNRKIAKLHELDGTSGTGTAARDQAVIDEMAAIVDDMVEFKWYRVEQNVVRFTDNRFGKPHDGGYKYNEPDAEGFIPLLGAENDVSVAYTVVTNAGYALFDPSHSYAAGLEGHPVVNVSYEDAVRYCEWLTDNSPSFAYKYRLPSQEEWELAAGHMPKDASINAGGVTNSTTDVYYFHSVYGSQAVSLSGTLDMWGNVWEWLATPDADGNMKIKGGAYDEDRGQCRTEERGNSRPASGRYANVGFRILRTKNQAAAVIENAQSKNWISRNLGLSLEAKDYRELERDHDGDGVPTWQEFIAMTNPQDAESRFRATIMFDETGRPEIGWNTGIYASRIYTVYGKENLNDSVWIPVNGCEELYRFFKVIVEMK